MQLYTGTAAFATHAAGAGWGAFIDRIQALSDARGHHRHVADVVTDGQPTNVSVSVLSRTNLFVIGLTSHTFFGIAFVTHELHVRNSENA